MHGPPRYVNERKESRVGPERKQGRAMHMRWHTSSRSVVIWYRARRVMENSGRDVRLLFFSLYFPLVAGASNAVLSNARALDLEALERHGMTNVARRSTVAQLDGQGFGRLVGPLESDVTIGRRLTCFNQRAVICATTRRRGFANTRDRTTAQVRMRTRLRES